MEQQNERRRKKHYRIAKRTKMLCGVQCTSNPIVGKNPTTRKYSISIRNGNIIFKYSKPRESTAAVAYSRATHGIFKVYRDVVVVSSLQSRGVNFIFASNFFPSCYSVLFLSPSISAMPSADVCISKNGRLEIEKTSVNDG